MSQVAADFAAVSATTSKGKAGSGDGDSRPLPDNVSNQLVGLINATVANAVLSRIGTEGFAGEAALLALAGAPILAGKLPSREQVHRMTRVPHREGAAW